MAYKFGYGDDVEKFKKEAHKYSLLNDGTLDKPDCTRLLLVNVRPTGRILCYSRRLTKCRVHTTKSSRSTTTTSLSSMAPRRRQGAFSEVQLKQSCADPRDRFVPGIKHMGEPESFFIIMNWIYKLFGIKGNAGQQLSTMPFKPKY